MIWLTLFVIGGIAALALAVAVGTAIKVNRLDDDTEVMLRRTRDFLAVQLAAFAVRLDVIEAAHEDRLTPSAN